MTGDGPFGLEDVPAGWHPDPLGWGALRYHDGTRWTEHVAGEPTSQPAPAGEATSHESTATSAPGWFPDPTDATFIRFWDGTTWTQQRRPNPAFAAGALGPRPDAVAHPPQPALPPPPVGAGRQITTAPAPTSGRTKTTGDKILDVASTVTLNKWIQNRMAKAFYIPQLVEVVQAEPRSWTARLHLGLRLLEMDIMNDRVNRSIAPTSAVGLVTRPVTRSVTRAVSQSLKSDKTKPHDRVLESAFMGALNDVTKNAVDVRSILVLARIYWIKGDSQKAWELMNLVATGPKDVPEASYIAAEAAWSLGAYAQAQWWAQQAVSKGCSLGSALLQPGAAALRAELHSTSSSYFNSPTTARFWQTKARYYQYTSRDDLIAFFGPSPIADATGAH